MRTFEAALEVPQIDISSQILWSRWLRGNMEQ